MSSSLVAQLLARHASRPRHAARRRERVAVCFSGYAGASAVAGGEGIRRHLVDPLEADVLMAMTHGTDAPVVRIPGLEAKYESYYLKSRFPALAPFAATALAPQLTLDELVDNMEALPHWPQLLNATSCTRNLDWGKHDHVASGKAPSSSKPYTCPPTARVTGHKGNNIFAPVLGSEHLSVLRQLHDLSRALGLLRTHEVSSGMVYDRVVHSRLEDVWLRDHPPLALLPATAADAWVPVGEDYLALNDRHAVLTRAAADVYFSRWEHLQNGSVLDFAPELRRGQLGLVTSEGFLGRLLGHTKLRVGRFASTHFLACCGKRRCFEPACFRRPLPAPSDVRAACAAHQAAGVAPSGPSGPMGTLDEPPLDLDAPVAHSPVEAAPPSEPPAEGAGARHRSRGSQPRARATLLPEPSPAEPSAEAAGTRLRTGGSRPRTGSNASSSGLNASGWLSSSLEALSIDEDIRGKYGGEVELAAAHALALEVPGARYVLLNLNLSRAGAHNPPELRVGVPRAHGAALRAMVGAMTRGRPRFGPRTFPTEGLPWQLRAGVEWL